MEAKSHYQSAVHIRICFYAVCAVVGVVVSLGTIGLIEMIDLIQGFIFSHVSSQSYVDIAANSSVWLVLLVPAIGGLLVGILIHLLKGQRYHGIADVMEACAMRGARMDARSGVGAAIAASISMGSGVPVGREGPAVHIGASISAWLAEKLNFTLSDSLTLLGCGAAAAVTASFNAPIAGVLFALEVIVGYYTMRVFAPIVIASIGSVILRRTLQGDDTAFDLSLFSLNSLWELPLFALLGLFCAFFVLTMIFLVGRIQDFWQKSTVPIWLRPAIGGLIIGFIATQFPHILGSGFGFIDQLFNQTAIMPVIAGLLIMRLLATSIALGSGFAGGVFTPSLVFGALLGALIWAIASEVLPFSLSGHAVYSIAGMGGLASAMLGAPISTVLIVFELTANYEVTVAVMLATAIASALMQLSPYTSYFRWQLLRRGVNITIGRDQSLLRTQLVDNLVKQDYSLITDSTKIIDVERQLSKSRHRIAILIDEKNKLIGSASLRLLVAASIDQGFEAVAAESLHESGRSVPLHTNVVAALQAMAHYNMDYMPVVDPAEHGEPIFKGIIFRDDLMRSYYHVIRTARAEEFGIN